MTLGVVRHLLTLVGGYLVAHGSLDQVQATQGVGAICTLIGIAWSLHEKRSSARSRNADTSWGQPVLIAAGIGLLGLVLIGSGCASAQRVTTADIQFRFGTNVVTVSQPKDTVIESLEFDPETGRLTLHGYQSTASAAALAAMQTQNAAQAQVVARGLDLIESLAARAAQSQGVPMAPAAPKQAIDLGPLWTSPTNIILVPSGVVLTNNAAFISTDALHAVDHGTRTAP